MVQLQTAADQDGPPFQQHAGSHQHIVPLIEPRPGRRRRM
jgi:hypothetical protein